jgi:PPM family protein phosphatase
MRASGSGDNMSLAIVKVEPLPAETSQAVVPGGKRAKAKPPVRS